MKLLKYLLFLILIVIIGGSIYIATLDGDYQVEETKVIDAPVGMVFNEVNEYKNWEVWGPWEEFDPNMVYNYPEKTFGEGASYSWESEESMDGKMETIKVVPNKSIEQKIYFETPIGETESTVYWKFEPVENKTKLTWGMKGEQSFTEKAMMLFNDQPMEKSLSEMYEKGLVQLNDVLVENKKQYQINVDGFTEFGGTYYMYSTTASKNTPEVLSKNMNQLFPQVAEFMAKSSIEQSGQPFTIYNNIDDKNNTVIYSCGIPTNAKVATPDDSPVLCGFLDRTNAIKATLKGQYKNLPEAWKELEKYVANSNYQKNPDTPPFEIYITDPGQEPNPANWETEIYLPVIEKDSTNLQINNVRSLP